MEQLRTLLEERFFAHAELIKANTVLRKAWGPCMVGMGRLRNLERERQRERTEGMSILKILRNSQLNDGSSEQIASYIQTSMRTADADLGTIRALRKKLDDLRAMAFDNFEALEKDLQSITALEGDEGRALSSEDRRKLAVLFGLEGAEVWRRLGHDTQTDDPHTLLESAEDMMDYWESRHSRGVPHRHLVEHARNRIDQILDSLEENI